MTCEEIREKISVMADQELSDEECALVTEHLAACPECMMVYEAFASLSDALSELDDLPEGFSQSVMHKVRARARVPKLKRGLFRAAGLAACFALVLFTGRTAGLFPAQNENDAAVRSVSTVDEVQADNGATPFSAAKELAEDADASLMEYSYAAITPGSGQSPVSSAMYSQEDAAAPDLLREQLAVSAAAEYGLFSPPADYTVTFYNTDKDSDDLDLSIWLDGDRLYCQDELTQTAYYAVCSAEDFLSTIGEE